MNIVFAGTPDFAVDPLIEIAKEHKVVAVLTQPDRAVGRGKKITSSAVKLQAQQLNIQVHQPINTNDLQKTLESLKPDVIIVVAYGMIFTQAILDIPTIACINIHASLLPKWRGAAPIQRSIEYGDEITGVSIMKMEKGLDSGPVYKTLSTPITINDTSEDLHKRLSKLGSVGVLEVLNKLAHGEEPKFIDQIHNDATYAKKLSKQEAKIDWSNSAKKIQQQIRAYIPWPICQTQHHNTRIRIWKASTKVGATNVKAGMVLDINQDGIVIACGVDALVIERLQKDGSKQMDHLEFCNGYTMSKNDMFI